MINAFSSNALPMIPRGLYLHLAGYNQGQPYTLLDIYQVCCLDLVFLYIVGCVDLLRMLVWILTHDQS